MNGRRNLNMVLAAVVVVVAMAAQVAGENAATNPQPPDGAVTAAEVSGTNLYMVLDYSPGAGAVSHTGYFSDKCADVAVRDAAHCLGSPPYPASSRTAYFVGLNASEIPAFARAPLERGKTYYWAVDEFDGTMSWPGEVWTFTVMTVEPWNPNPRDGARYVVVEGDTTLSWSQGDVEMPGWKTVYRIYYGTDRGIVEAATTANVSTGIESCTVSGLIPGTEYFWRVDTMLIQVTPPFSTRTIRGKIWRFETFGGMPVIYVDADANGANNGSSWKDAYKHLQDALADANTAPKPAEIRVAQGTYRPDEDTAHPNGTGDRTATFWLINGVTVKGGYAGLGQPEPDARDWEIHEAVLSGDLAGNDVEGLDPSELLDHPSRSENSLHVTTASDTNETAILDGFIITRGCANGDSDPDVSGGGLFSHSGSPTISNCIFRENLALLGAGACNYNGGNPHYVDCVFERTWAYAGGGMLNFESSPRVAGCTFRDNSGVESAGVYNSGGRPAFTDCVFSANTALELGGAMVNNGANSAVTGCVFAGNSARNGAAMSNLYCDNVGLTDCTFEGNLAPGSEGRGGGLYVGFGGTTLTNCTFKKNVAHDSGGGVYVALGEATLTGCAFTDNTAGFSGGGAFIWYSSSAAFTNCTFAGNLGIQGRTLGCDSSYHKNPNHIPMTNCILWNAGDEIWNRDGSAISIRYSNVWAGWPGEGNIDANPCFVDPGYWDVNGTPEDANDDFWLEGDYHLLPDSPCVNAGDPNFVAQANDVDMDGEVRVMLGRVDMGADEFNPFVAEFVVVRKERVGRTIFEYDCEVVLQNISRFAVRNVSLEMAKVSENMTIIDSEVSFSNSDIPPGASARSVDTCAFTVDRAEAIDRGGIVWRVTAELADTGAKMEHTLTSMPPVGQPETGFEYLAGLAEQWLWIGPPGGIDEDTIPDGTVNLADFARFADNWKTNP